MKFDVNDFPRRLWSEKEKKILVELLEEGIIYKEISNALNKKGYYRSPEAIRKMSKKIYRDIEEESFVESDITIEEKYFDIEKEYSDIVMKTISKDDDYDEDHKLLFCNAKEKKEFEKEQIKIKSESTLQDIRKHKKNILQTIVKRYEKHGRPEGKLYKILSISDLHIPFENEDVVLDAVNNNLDADILVLNGDIFDMYSVSKWPKNKLYLLIDEYKQATKWLRFFADRFKKIFIVKGNHDERLQSLFMSSIDPGIFFMVHPDALERLANGYVLNNKNILYKKYDYNNVHYSNGPCSWYVKIGEAIFVHPNRFSSVPMKTATLTAEKFIMTHNFSTIILGHTHKQGRVIYKDKLLIEQGCCCIPMEYEADAKMKYNSQAFGYAVVYMNSKGEVDFELSKPIYYGTATISNETINIGE